MPSAVPYANRTPLPDFTTMRSTSGVDVPHFSAGGAVTFELVLAENDGGIGIRYRDTDFGNPEVDRGTSATAGIENATGTRGRQLGFNVPGLSSGTAFRCSTDPGRSVRNR